jgi:hypothetical protein
MKIGMFRKVSSATLLLAWALIPAAGHAACATTAASLKGWYGLLVAGQTTAATPATKYLVGAALFDGVSSFSGSNLYGAAGAHTAVTGTYAVNTDCTVALTTTVPAAATYTVAVKATGEAVGIETDATAVSTISLKPQYATLNTGLNFTLASLNGTFVESCGGFLGAYSDLNLAVFSNGTLTGGDPYNNAGSYVVSDNPYSGTYTVNSDGTFAGSLVVDGANFDYYGVISTSNTKLDYIYTNVANGAPTNAIASCSGGVAPAVNPTATPPLTIASNPSSVTVTPPLCIFIICLFGQSANDTITVSAGGGTGTTSFAVSGLPAGVTASFSPATVTGNGSTTLTLTPGAGTASGASTTLTVIATSGATTATTSLGLNY